MDRSSTSADGGKQSPDGFWRAALAFGGAGFVLIGAIGVGGWLGYLLDKEFNTRPWLLVSGFLLGSITGFIEIYRFVRKFTK